MPESLVICGPTASGKTDFAHHLALKYNGEIVNCDSMQIYRNIPIITASPSLELRSELPYHLYNFQNISREFSVVKYVEVAAVKIKEIINRRKIPIIVGGTGMYINALLYGYNRVPEISNKVRNDTKELHNELGQQNFFNLLKELDPLAGAKLNANDIQRSLRAYEVFLETTQSIFVYQSQENITPLKEIDFRVFFLYPQRSFLYNLCNKRLIDIFKNGAIDEVKNIKEIFCDLKTPAIKVIGFQEIISYLENIISLDEAIDHAQKRTRQYAKRQITWFKHQIREKTVLEYSNFQEFEQLKNINLY